MAYHYDEDLISSRPPTSSSEDPFNASDKAWFVYDGRRWARDHTGETTRCAKSVVQAWLLAALGIDEQNYERAVKYAVRASGRRVIEAMVELAKCEMSATPEQFDRDPFVLNVANGTLDLRTGILRPHDPRDMLTKLAPVAYQENAEAPRWLQFLNEIFIGRRDLIDYLHLVFGYALTGDTSEHLLLIAYGLGANGKSVLVRLLQAMLGDYALHADVGLFLARREHGATPELARLKGVRFVAASEMPEGGRLSENLVKALTGGDRIAARHLYGEIFEFKPSAKFMIATNYKPIVRGDDDGIWRRLKLIPFEARFDGATCDKHLGEKLELELPGILRWAVEGCRRWLAEGLRDPKPVLAAMAAYRSDSDTIGTFLAERCIKRDTCEVRASSLRADYKTWCEVSSEKTLPARTFLAKIRERGFGGRRSNGDVVFAGLGLRDSLREA